MSAENLHGPGSMLDKLRSSADGQQWRPDTAAVGGSVVKGILYA